MFFDLSAPVTSLPSAQKPQSAVINTPPADGAEQTASAGATATAVVTTAAATAASATATVEFAMSPSSSSGKVAKHGRRSGAKGVADAAPLSSAAPLSARRAIDSRSSRHKHAASEKAAAAAAATEAAAAATAAAAPPPAPPAPVRVAPTGAVLTRPFLLRQQDPSAPPPHARSHGAADGDGFSTLPAALEQRVREGLMELGLDQLPDVHALSAPVRVDLAQPQPLPQHAHASVHIGGAEGSS